MATEARVITNLMNGVKACLARLNYQMCVFNGYDPATYFDREGRSGYLGLMDWSTATYKPTAVRTAGGHLTANKYYSVVAVPIDTKYPNITGVYRMGNPTMASTAVVTSAAQRTIRFTLPNRHPQNTFAGSAEANYIYWYCSQASPTAATAEAGTKYYIGATANTAGITIDLSADPTTTADAAAYDNYEPPNISHACVMNNRVFGICNITEGRGQVRWNPATARFEGRTYGAFTISSIASQGNDVWRYAFSGAPDLSAITIAMTISASGCTDSKNSVSLRQIVAVDNTAKYIDIRNPIGVAQAGAAGTCTVYTTFIGEGMEGSTFSFENDGTAQRYTLSTINKAGQYFTAVEGSYTGLISGYGDFVIKTTDRKLWYSKTDEPNAWPSDNVLQFEEDLTAVAPAGEYLAVFSKNTVYIVNPRTPNEFRKTNAPVGTESPYSIISTENGLYFYDGKLFRVFDGLQAVEFTSRRVSNFMGNINAALKGNVHGTYVPTERSVRWFLPYGTSIVCNYYVEYNLSTGFWWLGQCYDAQCSAVLSDPITGDTTQFTGSTTRFCAKGFVNQWGGTYKDGVDSATTAMFGTVMGVAPLSYTINISVSGVIDGDDIGCPFTIFDPTGTTEYHLIAKTITHNGGNSYTIEVHTDFDLTGMVAGYYVAWGTPSFTWGIKWMDFGNPQYKHELKEVRLDFDPVASTVYGIVDFYTDYHTTPNKSVLFMLSAGDTATVVRYHGARGNQVGFKIRLWSANMVEIKDLVAIHRTIV